MTTVSPIDADRFRRRPAENEWSVAEILHHLYLVEDRVINELEKALAGEPQKAGWRSRFIPASLAASRLVKVKAPKAVVPNDAPEKQVAIVNFENSRTRLKELWAREGEQKLRRIAIKHPFFGKIDGTAAVSFVSYHELRHFRQIEEVLRKN